MKTQYDYFCVIGSGKLVDVLINSLLAHRFTKEQFLGKVEIPACSTNMQLRPFIEKSQIIRDSNLVYMDTSKIDAILVNDLLALLENDGKTVKLILDLNSSAANDLVFRRKKRIFDILFSLIAILLLFPFFIIIAAITFLSSKGPILYKQERIGRDGKSFIMYKLRSMNINAEISGPALAMKNDPRVTPWGRFMRRYKLDELPQFYNCMAGNMSIVGPRPEREFWMQEIEKESFQFRKLTSIKPGITSLGQVKFGYAINVQEMRKRLRYDLLYLNNLSIKMDIKIIMMTMGVILRGYK
jgi:lipopolysaccharide/colanic/teichoic acid biosynthesis glycosyltransferase